MKVRFYPISIGMFEKEFDFSDREIHSITLEVKHTKDYKDFHDRAELIEWLKTYKVELDDPTYPLMFTNVHYSFGNVYSVVQQSLLGWMKEL